MTVNTNDILVSYNVSTLFTNVPLDETIDILEKLVEHRTKGAILRSKIVWYNEGEKNTKYFLNLEIAEFLRTLQTLQSSP